MDFTSAKDLLGLHDDNIDDTESVGEPQHARLLDPCDLEAELGLTAMPVFDFADFCRTIVETERVFKPSNNNALQNFVDAARPQQNLYNGREPRQIVFEQPQFASFDTTQPQLHDAVRELTTAVRELTDAIRAQKNESP